MSVEQERQAEFEIQQLLSSIPSSKFMARYDVMDKAIDALETSIKRLKAFVRFLSLLSPTKYIEWMKQAYAQYVPAKTPIEAKVDPAKNSTPNHFKNGDSRNSKAPSTAPNNPNWPTL